MVISAERYAQPELDRIHANSVVRYAVYPGQAFAPQDGDPSNGVQMEYLRAIARTSGLVFRPVEVTDVEQATLALRQHELDLLPVLSSSQNAQPAPGLITMTRPYLVATAVVIARGATANIFRLSELEGLRIAVRRDSLLHRLLGQQLPAVTLMPVVDANEELALVSRGLADAAVDVDAVLLPRWRKLYFSKLHVAGTISDLLLTFRMGVRSDDAVLLAMLDKALASLTAEQTDVLMAKWLGDSNYGAPSWRVHFRFHAPEITAALILLIGLICFYLRACRERRRAVRGEQEKSLFLAVMSHEIRLPLSAVLSAVELLRHTRISRRQKKLLATAGTAADALLRLVDDVLDLSKLGAGGMHLNNAPTNVAALARNMVEIVKHQAAQKGLALKLHTEVPDDARVLLDATRFQQVVINLLGNAIKFTHQGSVTLEVTLTANGDDATSRKLSVRVTDTGIGIPAQQRSRLFRAYVQADSTIARRYGGTGLGLSISRQLVELMGGSIDLRSEVNVGTAISFRLPVQLAPIEATTTPDRRTRHPKPGRAKAVSVLLVEDHPASRLVFDEQLRSIGCQVTACADGTSALRFFGSKVFDLVLIDAGLPDLSGYEVTRMMRERENDGHHTPIYSLSAYTDTAHRMACIEHGMDGVLKKPLELSLLRAKIRDCCDVELPDPKDSNDGEYPLPTNGAASSPKHGCIHRGRGST
ncbi:hybrid sensor histidine kinase/response regulator [Dyella flagellata]|uniref:histidine kinase n=1 Tax=Dyella flagellata TaxID=1867833 RepID=A0ABQ5X6R7_9GAMM|nr:ATP-binding protein [Dyella flagellata]GLQ86866.1 hypothetical protein GCM10007898_04320 [Dyella flagellata]